MVGLDSGAENHIFLPNRGTSIRLQTAILFQCVFIHLHICVGFVFLNIISLPFWILIDLFFSLKWKKKTDGFFYIFVSKKQL